MTLTRLRNWVAGSFSAFPAIMVIGFGSLAALLTWGDAALWSAGLRFSFAGGPDAARTLLSAVASSTLTLAGLSFSVTLVVLVLASSQFSPRVLRTFLRDRRTKLALGVFLGTYVYALVALRAVRSAEEGLGSSAAFVPGVTMTGSFLLALASIGVFVFFIDHVVQSVRVEHIIGRIAADTRTVIDTMYPTEPSDGGVAAIGETATDEPASEDAAPGHNDGAARSAQLPGGVVTTILGDHAASSVGTTYEVVAHRPGVVSSVDIEGLVEAATDADVLVTTLHGVGTFLPEGAPLLTVIGAGDVDVDVFRRQVSLYANRTVVQDAAFGFRQLVDIAERALSPGINDPTTAVQALDQIHDLLRRLATRPLGDGRWTDDHGVLRVTMPVLSWDDYVRLSLDEVRHWGAGSLQIHHRVRGLVDDLLTVVDNDRAAVLHNQIALLDARGADALHAVEQWSQPMSASASRSADPAGSVRATENPSNTP